MWTKIPTYNDMLLLNENTPMNGVYQKESQSGS